MSKKGSLTDWDGRWRSHAFWFATWFGSGLLRPAPGTWGSLAGLPIVLVYLSNTSSVAGGLALIGMLSFLTLLGVWAIAQIERSTGVHDAPEIVIDEVVGVSLAALPMFFLGSLISHTWIALAVAFGLFRVFDILKPWPIRLIDEQVPGAWGVMLDDIVAGIFAAIVLTGLIFGGIL